jgi:microcystin-dependent protein
MHRIDGPAAAPGGHFTEGDPNVGTPATVVTDDWCNAVQEELANVVEATGAVLAKPNNAQLLAAIKSLISNAVPPGAVQGFALAAAPTGWLVADGSTFAASAYPALAAALGTTWGAAPAGQVRLPDLRGEFLRGLDLGRGVDAGRELGTSQASEVGPHTHATGWPMWDEGGQANNHLGSGGPGSESVTFNLATGTNAGSETRPRNVALLYCVKV